LTTSFQPIVTTVFTTDCSNDFLYQHTGNNWIKSLPAEILVTVVVSVLYDYEEVLKLKQRWYCNGIENKMHRQEKLSIKQI
jgi:hypothetical protein